MTEKQKAQARVAEFKIRLSTDRKWAGRALQVLWERQTPFEQEAHVTTVDNHQGFSGYDAEILTSFRNQLARYGKLSDRQWEIAHKRLARYAGQLVRVADEKASRVPQAID